MVNKSAVGRGEKSEWSLGIYHTGWRLLAAYFFLADATWIEGLGRTYKDERMHYSCFGQGQDIWDKFYSAAVAEAGASLRT